MSRKAISEADFDKKAFTNIKVHSPLGRRVVRLLGRFPTSSFAGLCETMIAQMVDLMEIDPKAPKEIPPIVRQSDAALEKKYFPERAREAAKQPPPSSKQALASAIPNGDDSPLDQIRGSQTKG